MKTKNLKNHTQSRAECSRPRLMKAELRADTLLKGELH